MRSNSVINRLAFYELLLSKSFCSNLKAHSCKHAPVEFPTGFFHVANEKVAEEPGKVCWTLRGLLILFRNTQIVWLFWEGRTERYLLFICFVYAQWLNSRLFVFWPSGCPYPEFCFPKKESKRSFIIVGFVSFVNKVAKWVTEKKMTSPQISEIEWHIHAVSWIMNCIRTQQAKSIRVSKQADFSLVGTKLK